MLCNIDENRARKGLSSLVLDLKKAAALSEKIRNREYIFEVFSVTNNL